MAQINQLPTRTIAAGDVVPFFSTTNGDAAKTSFTSIAALISDILGLDSAAQQVTQFESPGDAFTITITEQTASTWLVITPVAAGYTGAIVLPASTSAADQMEIVISSDASVTLTFSSTGASVISPVYGLATGGSVTFKYESVLKRWYQIASIFETAAP